MIYYKFPRHAKERARGTESIACQLAFFSMPLSAVFLLPYFQTLPLFCLSEIPTMACLWSKIPRGNQVLRDSSGHSSLIFEGESTATQEPLLGDEQQSGRELL